VKKIHALDGLRGIAALIVINEHYLKFFFPLAFADYAIRPEGIDVINNLSFPPFNLLHNGAFAVCMFFVLSGYVLSIKYFNKNVQGAEITGDIIKRYFRLMIPVLGSLLVIYLFFNIGLFDSYPSAVSITGSTSDYVFKSDPGIVNLFKQGLWGSLFLASYEYNPPLWTITTEIYGSILIFLLQLFFLPINKIKHAFALRVVVYLLSIAVTHNAILFGFVLGMMLCDVKHNRNINDYLTKSSRFWVPIVLGVGLVLSAYMIRGLYNNPYQYITLYEFNEYYEYIYNTWGAFLLLSGILYSKRLLKYLEIPLLVSIGRISFSMYLLHYIFLMSISAYVFIGLGEQSYLLRVGLSISTGLIATIIFSYLFNHYLNKTSIRMSSWIGIIVTSVIKSPKDKLIRMTDDEIRQA